MGYSHAVHRKRLAPSNFEWQEIHYKLMAILLVPFIGARTFWNFCEQYDGNLPAPTPIRRHTHGSSPRTFDQLPNHRAPADSPACSY